MNRKKKITQKIELKPNFSSTFRTYLHVNTCVCIWEYLKPRAIFFIVYEVSFYVLCLFVCGKMCRNTDKTVGGGVINLQS